MNLFVVQSPLQVLNAIEAKHAFGCPTEESVLVVLSLQAGSCVCQVKNALAGEEWAEVIYPFGEAGIGLLERARALRKVYERFPGTKRIFLGEYRSPYMRHLAHNLPAAERYVLDDGNVTLLIHHNLMHGLQAVTWRDQFKRLLGLKVSNLPNFGFFTVYEMKPTTAYPIIRHTFEHLRSTLGSLVQSHDVYFLGSNLAEMNIVEVERYDAYMDAIRKEFAGRNLKYLPHRREDDAKLERMRAAGWEIVRFENCVEVELSRRNELPRVVAGFMSSALFNLYAIFGDLVEVVSYRIPEADIQPKHRLEIEEAYVHYEHESQGGVRVVKLLPEGPAGAQPG